MKEVRQLQLSALAAVLALACVLWVHHHHSARLEKPFSLSAAARATTPTTRLHLGRKIQNELKEALDIHMTRTRFEKESREVQNTEKSIEAVLRELRAAAKAKAQAEYARLELHHLHAKQTPKASTPSGQGNSRAHEKKHRLSSRAKVVHGSSLSDLIKGLLHHVHEGVLLGKEVPKAQEVKGDSTQQHLSGQFSWPDAPGAAAKGGGPVVGRATERDQLGDEFAKMNTMQKEVRQLARILDRVAPVSSYEGAGGAIPGSTVQGDGMRSISSFWADGPATDPSSKSVLNSDARQKMEEAIEQSG